MTTVVIVDDQAMIRFALRGILEFAGDIAVLGEAERGAEGVDLARSLRPDVILMDLRMPGMDGIEAIRRIRAESDLASVRILVLTTFEADDNVLAALHAGANGFLGKGAEPDELIAAVRQVGAGGALLSPAATQSVLDHLAAEAAAAPPPTTEASLSTAEQVADLTPREREIVSLVAEGLLTEAIAARLFISPYTAKTHINRAMAKLGVSTRAQLVRVAFDYGLVGRP
jgi:DNA-binding NarL/FixJ family response regulator